MTICGNLLSDAQYNVHLRYARGVVIQGNCFWRGHAAHLLAQHADHLLISGNLMDRNPDYDRQGQGRDALRFIACRQVTLMGNHIVGPEGDQGFDLFLERCRHAVLNDNVLYHGTGKMEQCQQGWLGPTYPPGRIRAEQSNQGTQGIKP